MQKILLLSSIGLLFFCMAVSAQKANTDSLSLVAKISANQLKLGKLQNQVEQQTKNKQEALEQAQRSANENADAAGRLSYNPDDKKLARKAGNKANEARNDSRNARKEASRLDKLNRDIKDLQYKIANDQVKLNKYVQDGLSNRSTIPETIKTDTTQH